VLFGAGAVILLYLDPLWIAIGGGVVAVALVLHFVLSGRGPRPDDGS
jgi:hypothetical protein